MTRDEINEYLEDRDISALMLTEEIFDSACIGLSSDDRLIYDYDLLIKVLVDSDGMSDLEAAEYIDYNILSSLRYNYSDEAKMPLVIYNWSWYEL